MADYHDRDARVLMNNRLDEHLISATIRTIQTVSIQRSRSTSTSSRPS